MPPVDVMSPEPDPRNQQPLDTDFTVLIVPGAIPIPGTSVEVLQTAAANLRAAAEEVAEGGAGVESSWQALQAHYTAPEAETLFSAMGPVARKGDTILEDVTTVVTALEAFAEAAENTRTRLRTIRDDAEAFVEEMRDKEYWALNPLHYHRNRHLKLWANIVWAEFQEAERECGTAISSVNGRNSTYTAAGGGAPGPGEIVYGLDPGDVPDAVYDLTEFSEWQRAGEESWAHLTGSAKPWPLDWAADAFVAQQENFGVGMLWGLGVSTVSATGLWREGSGWATSAGEAGDNFLTHKEEMFQGYGALVGMHGEDGWMNPFDSGERSGATWRANAGAAWTEIGHDLVPWREWEDRPAYTVSTGAGNLALTVVAFPVRGGLLLSRIGGGPDIPDVDVLDRPEVAWETGAAARPGFSLAGALDGNRAGFSDVTADIGLRLEQMKLGVLGRFADWTVVEGAPEPDGRGGRPGGPDRPGAEPTPAPVPAHAGEAGEAGDGTGRPLGAAPVRDPDTAGAGATAPTVLAGRGDEMRVGDLVDDLDRYSGMDADRRVELLRARHQALVGADGREIADADGPGEGADFRITAAHDPDSASTDKPKPVITENRGDEGRGRRPEPTAGGGQDGGGDGRKPPVAGDGPRSGVGGHAPDNIGDAQSGDGVVSEAARHGADQPIGAGGEGGPGPQEQRRSGRREWPAQSDIEGPARGLVLREPHPRHTMGGIKNGQVRPENSVVLPSYIEAMRNDIADIASGAARFDQGTQRYEVNGRVYGIESSGTVFPDSGEGIVKMDRIEYDALKQIARVRGDISKIQKMFDNNPKFKNNPDAVEFAIKFYEEYG